MKLYHKIMLVVCGALLVCGAFCCFWLGNRYLDRQLSRLTEEEITSFEGMEYILREVYEISAGEAERPEMYNKRILGEIFENDLFEDCILQNASEIICDHSPRFGVEYETFAGQAAEGKIDFGIHTIGGAKILVLAAGEPWVSADAYLFRFRDVTVVYEDMWGLLRTFAAIWILFLILLMLVSAAFMKFLLRPLKALEQAAYEVSRGNYDGTIETGGKDELGDISRAFAIMKMGIREREEKLEEVNEQQKLLIGSLSHEIRSPMTSVLGYTDMLLHVEIDEDTGKMALQTIYDQANYLKNLSAKMMELSGLYQNNSIQVEDCSVGQLLEESRKTAARKWPEITFVWKEKEDFRMSGDTDLLTSLFQNLLDNGAKASRPGQKIEIGLRPGFISIRDFGKGIPEEEIGKICRPFYKVDRSRTGRDGIGLGLAICRQIMEFHHGEMNIESVPGKGTTISLQFVTNC